MNEVDEMDIRIQVRNTETAQRAVGGMASIAAKIIDYAMDIDNLRKLIYDEETGWAWQDAIEDLRRIVWARAVPVINQETGAPMEQEVPLMNADGTPVLDENGNQVMTKGAVVELPYETIYDVADVLEARIDTMQKVFGFPPEKLLDDAVDRSPRKLRALIAGGVGAAKLALLWEKELRNDLAYFREGAILHLLAQNPGRLELYDILNKHPKLLKFIAEYCLKKLSIRPMLSREREEFERQYSLKKPLYEKYLRQAAEEAKAREAELLAKVDKGTYKVAAAETPALEEKQ